MHARCPSGAQVTTFLSFCIFSLYLCCMCGNAWHSSPRQFGARPTRRLCDRQRGLMAAGLPPALSPTGASSLRLLFSIRTSWGVFPLPDWTQVLPTGVTGLGPCVCRRLGYTIHMWVCFVLGCFTYCLLASMSGMRLTKKMPKALVQNPSFGGVHVVKRVSFCKGGRALFVHALKCWRHLRGAGYYAFFS